MMLQVPPIPKKEKLAITIANQAMQIDNLLIKIESLTQDLARSRTDRNDWRNQVEKITFDLEVERKFRKTDVDRLDEAQALIARLESQIEGYRMAIRDICS